MIGAPSHVHLEKGVEHALRSRRHVVEIEMLSLLDLSPAGPKRFCSKLSNCTTTVTHARPVRPKPCYSAKLTARISGDDRHGTGVHHAGPKDVAVCYRRILDRRAGIEGRFTLPRAQEVAKMRLARMRNAWSGSPKKASEICDLRDGMRLPPHRGTMEWRLQGLRPLSARVTR